MKTFTWTMKREERIAAEKEAVKDVSQGLVLDGSTALKGLSNVVRASKAAVKFFAAWMLIDFILEVLVPNQYLSCSSSDLI